MLKPTAKDRLIATASLIGLQQSVQILHENLVRELWRVLTTTKLGNLIPELRRVIGSEEAALGLVAPPVVRKTRRRPTLYRRVPGPPIETSPQVEEPFGAEPQKPVAYVDITEAGDIFTARFSDGRETWKSKRRRDLVRRAKILGYVVNL